MMGIEVSETFWAYCKCNKTINWHLVGFSSLRICNDARKNTHQIMCQVGHLPEVTSRWTLRGVSPRANYTDRAAAGGRRSWCQLFFFLPETKFLKPLFGFWSSDRTINDKRKQSRARVITKGCGNRKEWNTQDTCRTRKLRHWLPNTRWKLGTTKEKKWKDGHKAKRYLSTKHEEQGEKNKKTFQENYFDGKQK